MSSIVQKMDDEMSTHRVREWTEKSIELIQKNITQKIRENPHCLKQFIKDKKINLEDWKNPYWNWEENDGMIFMNMRGETYNIRFWCDDYAIVEWKYGTKIPYFYECFEEEMILYQVINDMNSQSTWGLKPKLRVDKIKKALETYLTNKE